MTAPMRVAKSLLKVTEPGVYAMPADVYHADPVPGGSLSSSGAKLLLPPSCPAKFRHYRDHGRPDTKAFDEGHAAHRLVLGDGPEIAVLDADSWRTKAAQTWAEEARAEGLTPLLGKEAAVVYDMADALRRDPVAGKLFDPASGAAERSLFWQDERTGIWRRARLDWLPTPFEGRRMILVDYKSCRSADPEAISKAINEYGYHQQAPWYQDAVEGAMGLPRPAFVFVFQEKTAPYVVTVVEPDPTSLRIGAHLNREAIRVYRECVRTDTWPGYSTGVELVPLPAWAEKRYQLEAV